MRSVDPLARLALAPMRVFAASLRLAKRGGARQLGSRLLLLPVLAMYGSPVEPPRSVPLMVVNTTCTPGPCQVIRVLAFPQNQPRTPGGMWSLDLGTVGTPTGCVLIPASAHFTINDATTGQSDIVPWTSRDSVALGSWPPSEALFTATSSTGWFVAQSARGWRVALPGDDRPSPAPACRA